MMCRSNCLLLAALLSVLLLHLCSESQAANSFDCCLHYTKRFFHHKHIYGYREQKASGGCDMDAIIFYLRKRLVCADPNKHWVKQAVSAIKNRTKVEK